MREAVSAFVADYPQFGFALRFRRLSCVLTTSEPTLFFLRDLLCCICQHPQDSNRHRDIRNTAESSIRRPTVRRLQVSFCSSHTTSSFLDNLAGRGGHTRIESDSYANRQKNNL